jgi:hypothetical protein
VIARDKVIGESRKQLVVPLGTGDYFFLIRFQGIRKYQVPVAEFT